MATFPRWNLPSTDFLTTDATTVQNGIIAAYQELSGRTLAQGDPIRLFLLSIANIIIQLRTEINTGCQQNLLSYAQGDYLDALGRLLAVTRNPASAAQLTVQFTLSAALGQGYTIAAGTQVTNGTLVFETDSDLTIATGSTTGSVTATCLTAGETGNGVTVGEVNTLVEPLAYVASLTNTSISTGGADEEDDESFAARIRLAPNAFSVAGPYKAYEFWTYTASSAIIDVSIDSPTAGIVNVYPLLTDGALPNSAFCQSVLDVLSDETIRPLTDDVHVYAPTAQNYTITVDYYISNEDKANASTIQSAVTAAVEEYRLWQQSRVGRDIAPEKLVQLVMAAGASKIDSSTLSPSTFTTLTATQVAQCPAASVTVTFKGYRAI